MSCLNDGQASTGTSATSLESSRISDIDEAAIIERRVFTFLLEYVASRESNNSYWVNSTSYASCNSQVVDNDIGRTHRNSLHAEQNAYHNYHGQAERGGIP